ncbi:MAG TPA: gamma-glutamyltransferase, partial [Gaiellaceae bacterium]|nr:gamma-glutamyltransferase [Gaiellaceae bacterium]
MRGALAAGHPLTAEAGADVLRAGGNAVDACIAAAVVSWICESPLTGLGGGGFLLVHLAGDAQPHLLDFFVTVPQRAEPPEELIELVVDFGGTQQIFFTGPASVAVPGTGLGLWEAHGRWGSLPWPELLAPAARLARDGVVLDEPRAYLHEILDALLRHSPEGDALYGPERARGVGERFAIPELADTLDRLAREGPDCIYRGELAERIAAHVPLTLEDLAGYRVIEREPLLVPFRGGVLRTNPPPSSGGRLLAVGLEALGDAEPTALAVAKAMQAQESHAAGGTTHISVVDGDGNAAALSCSLGSASGIVVPGTGIHLNNMLGESHLTGAERPGERLMSLMAPSLYEQDGRPRLVLGSAGSRRLHGAIFQVVVNVAARGLGVEEAVEAPRMHAESGIVHCEDPAVADELEAAGVPVVRWRERNLFFGGVSAVEIRDDGTLGHGPTTIRCERAE